MHQAHYPNQYSELVAVSLATAPLLCYHLGLFHIGFFLDFCFTAYVYIVFDATLQHLSWTSLSSPGMRDPYSQFKILLNNIMNFF